MKKVYIAPSILTCPFYKLEAIIRELETAGIDYIHFDVMDGSFVPEIRYDAKTLRDIKSITNIPIDVHLMTDNTEHHIDSFAQAGADIISVHVENNYHAHKLLQKIKSYNIKAGVVFNPHSSIDCVDNLLDVLDYVLIMSVNPGVGGQSFIESSLDKINRVRSIIDKSGKDIFLAVDGGVNIANAAKIKASGADYLIAGTAIVESDNIANAVKSIREI